MKVVSLSAKATGTFIDAGNISGTYFWLRLIRPQDHSVLGSIMSMKKCNDAIGSRTHCPPACSAVIFRNKYFGLEFRRLIRFKICAAMFTG